MNFRQ